MRAICDSCESAPAVVFCAADEAALCAPCDQQVHGCNKLASRHLRLVLKESRDVPKCDICENARAFFFCGIDGTSLCMECDMAVHVGGKRTHTRYILIKQNVEFPAKQNEDENGMEEDEDKEEEDEEEVEEEEEEEEEEEKEDQMMQPFLEVGNKPPKGFLLKHMESCNVSSGWTIKEPRPQGNQQMSLSFDLNSNPTNA